ncbi:GNAT family N-acetyltransferase [uncultured Algibacter sp.]|uniref:GNAT family N-acetyltransferase n=1 Tax=uncultured Algibacter sp. TaxID=298659 RepID=UPI00262743F2|nr:GNAT family N-acetyltransferase [uncultured Algibacter sp.]
MDALELKYINVESSFYEEAVKLREHLFFKNMKNRRNLIQDDFELNGNHLICLSNGEVVGTGRLNIKNTIAIISQMAIKNEYQKRGVGSKILKALIIKSKENEVTKIELGARKTAIVFYEKFNFVSFGSTYASKKTGIIHQQMKLMIK